jgi:uncharacterized paraquat-inducible protein A
MTLTTHAIGAVEDIARIQFTCKRCSALIAIPVAHCRQMPATCPNCEHLWLTPGRPSNSQHAEALLMALKHFREAEDLRFTIAFDFGALASTTTTP